MARLLLLEKPAMTTGERYDTTLALCYSIEMSMQRLLCALDGVSCGQGTTGEFQETENLLFKWVGAGGIFETNLIFC